MNYTFKGKLQGLICSECLEPLSNVTVRLYKTRKDQNVTALAVANPKDTCVILTDDMVEKKASSLIAETETDENEPAKIRRSREYQRRWEGFGLAHGFIVAKKVE